jgi:tRNA threonylcarbamoyladenosine biosynthesis protein TsaB
VALLRNGVATTREERAGQCHSELLLPMVDSVLKEFGLSAKDLDGIAFGTGPGSFTGLRIACGVAQGIALGAALKLAPICTLMALAEGSGQRRVLSCLDARMGELYLAAYQRETDSWREVIAPMLCKPERAPMLPDADWYGVGSGFLAYGEQLRVRYGSLLAGSDAQLIPHAREIAKLAVPVFVLGQSVLPEDAAPLYVRNKVALKTAERRLVVPASFRGDV